ncbi:hypothetical protein BGW80DRAFT_154477 [Lactifluus volemus]|nr:hypothetical protein BGW80DRAFT_154477 [Lactifluus volemus]
MQHVSSSLFPQDIPIQAPPVTALMETTDVEATPASKKQQGFLAKIPQGLDAQLIACVPATRSRSGLPLQRYTRRSSPAPQSLPNSLSQPDPGELPGSITICNQIPVQNLPVPELIDASRPAPSRVRVSAYDHPALQPSAEDDTSGQRSPSASTDLA